MRRRKKPAPPPPPESFTVVTKLVDTESPDNAKRLIKAIQRGVRMARERRRKEEEKNNAA